MVEEENEEDSESCWRRLALQFDGHRMQAIGHLKCMVQDPVAHKEEAEKFLKAGPLSGTVVLENRLRAMATTMAQENFDLFMKEGECMKLDRNANPSGMGKYALVNLRKVPKNLQTEQGILSAIDPAVWKPSIIDFGKAGDSDEFFVLRLKDKYAHAALTAYAQAARADDPEYAAEVEELLSRAGPNSIYCKTPD